MRHRLCAEIVSLSSKPLLEQPLGHPFFNESTHFIQRLLEADFPSARGSKATHTVISQSRFHAMSRSVLSQLE